MELFTAQEVADKLKIKKTTVYELIKRGELKSTKIGKQIRISVQDLNNYLKLSSKIDTADQDLQLDEKAASKIQYFKPTNGLIIAGKDPLLDFLCTQINISGTSALRTPVCSYDGLYSLYYNRIHMAAVHLWDFQNNTYNTTFIEKLLPGKDVVLLHFVKRTQGLFVYKNNPKNIHSAADLTKPDIKFINRETGSGTRILFDGLLKKNNIKKDDITGYTDEVLSGFEVASAIFNREADVGIGCQNTLNQFSMLEFIPIQTESYDLVFYKADLNKPVFQTIINILHSEYIKSYISSIKGYDITDMGKLEYIG